MSASISTMGKNLKRGKCQVGFCSVCGKDVAIRKTDQKVFRHPNQHTGRRVCTGAGEYPKMIIMESGEVQNFIPVVIHEKAIDLEAETYEVVVPRQRRKVRTETQLSVNELDLGIIGNEYPVYTESGVVIGRARVDLGKITILGAKWAQRSA